MPALFRQNYNYANWKLTSSILPLGIPIFAAASLAVSSLNPTKDLL